MLAICLALLIFEVVGIAEDFDVVDVPLVVPVKTKAAGKRKGDLDLLERMGKACRSTMPASTGSSSSKAPPPLQSSSSQGPATEPKSSRDEVFNVLGVAEEEITDLLVY